jgi:hypothetical protein
LLLWTAASMRPSRSASSISFTNVAFTDVPEVPEVLPVSGELKMPGRVGAPEVAGGSGGSSPPVLMIASSQIVPVRSAIRRATVFACQSAR